jgi:hypothetical protein
MTELTKEQIEQHKRQIKKQFHQIINGFIKSLPLNEQKIARLRFAKMPDKNKQRLISMWAKMSGDARHQAVTELLKKSA